MNNLLTVLIILVFDNSLVTTCKTTQSSRSESSDRTGSHLIIAEDKPAKESKETVLDHLARPSIWPGAVLNYLLSPEYSPAEVQTIKGRE